ncbi:MAG: hypothetical protein ACI8RZ_006425 [Myxococcota bacterium]|jgi:hypothetical protein
MKNALILTASLLTLLTGCGTDTEADAYAAAMPDSRILVEMEASTARSNAGDASEFAFFTMNATTSVNGMITFVLTTVDTVTDFQPTWTDGEDTAVWGPYEDDGFNFALWVTHEADEGLYSWGINMKPVGTGDEAYETVIAGQADDTSNETAYAGWFAIDFDAISTLDPTETGAGLFVSSYEVNGDVVIASAGFEAFTDNNAGAERVDAIYHYEQTIGMEGLMDLVYAEDATGNGEDEVFIIRSRWLESRQGRADVAITGGELGEATFVATECWDEAFAVSYYSNNYELVENGDAASCVFDAPSYNDDAAAADGE